MLARRGPQLLPPGLRLFAQEPALGPAAAAGAPTPPPTPPQPAAAAAGASPAPLDFNDARQAFQAKPTGQLLRSLLVLQACRLRPLVAHADSLLRWSRRLLGRRATNAALRATFFRQFVAGEGAAGIRPTVDFLRAHGIHSILDYAAEDDVSSEGGAASRAPPTDTVVARTYTYEGEAAADRRMATFLAAIDAAAAVDAGRGFAAVKITALGQPALLERASTALRAITDLFRQFDSNGDGTVTREEFAQVYGTLFTDDSDDRVERIFNYLDVKRDGSVDYVSWTKQVTVYDMVEVARRCRHRGAFAAAALDSEEVGLLHSMMARLGRLAAAAKQAGVRLMIDAEHSYFQPAIDAAAGQLQAEHNKEAPAVFTTYQAYLVDAHSRLLLDLERARRGGYHLGAKIVRGAYMLLERERAQRLGYALPILPDKASTDESYDRCVVEMLRHVATGGTEVMLATHNAASIERSASAMAHLGIPPEGGVSFGQLLGMADHLTFTLAARGYRAYKYLPYGKIDEVVPYLIRRAQENSDMAGGVGAELALMRSELRRRLLHASH